MSAFKGWRTFGTAAVGIVVGGVAAVDDSSDWKSWALLILSALMAGLRAITTTAPRSPV